MEQQRSAGRSSRLGNIRVIRARMAASSGVVALATLVTVLGAPWKW
jgi:hypothetical protein